MGKSTRGVGRKSPRRARTVGAGERPARDILLPHCYQRQEQRRPLVGRRSRCRRTGLLAGGAKGRNRTGDTVIFSLWFTCSWASAVCNNLVIAIRIVRQCPLLSPASARLATSLATLATPSDCYLRCSRSRFRQFSSRHFCRLCLMLKYVSQPSHAHGLRVSSLPVISRVRLT